VGKGEVILILGGFMKFQNLAVLILAAGIAVSPAHAETKKKGDTVRYSFTLLKEVDGVQSPIAGKASYADENTVAALTLGYKAHDGKKTDANGRAQLSYRVDGDFDGERDACLKIDGPLYCVWGPYNFKSAVEASCRKKGLFNLWTDCAGEAEERWACRVTAQALPVVPTVAGGTAQTHETAFAFVCSPKKKR
jgi:hypothetical protein